MTKKILLGSMESDAPGDIVTLLGAAGVAQYETLQTKRGATGAKTTDYYQVPTGYELIMTNLYIWSSVAGSDAVIGYGDNAVAAGSTAPTNAVGLSTSLVLGNSAAKIIERVPVCLVIPAGKYPYVYSAGSAHIMVSGFQHRT